VPNRQITVVKGYYTGRLNDVRW